MCRNRSTPHREQARYDQLTSVDSFVGGPFKPSFGLSGAVLAASKAPTLVAKNATRMGHPAQPALVIMGNRDSRQRFPVKEKDRFLIRDGAGYAVSRRDYRRRAASERTRSMKTIRFVGLDVHAEKIAVAIAEPEGEVRFLGAIPNREESVRKLIRKLGDPESLRACYEAGPTRFVRDTPLEQKFRKTNLRINP